METLFITKGSRLKQHENTLQIQVGQHKRSLPINKISHLVLLAESRLNSRLLSLCGKHGVRISIFDYYGYFKGAYEPMDKNPAGKVKLKQAEYLLDTEQRMTIAREIVRATADNMMANLRYYQYRGKSDLKPFVQRLRQYSQGINKAQSRAELMGHEGLLHSEYYTAWKVIDEKLDFGKRVKRPPNNPINCLISFLNQMVYTVVRHEITKTHLEETFSFLHASGYGRASLSLDLAEPFKPLLSHGLIFRVVKLKILDDSWFEQKNQVCLLSELGRKQLAEQFSLRLESKYQGRTFREWIYYEALGIEREILGVAEYFAFRRKV